MPAAGNDDDNLEAPIQGKTLVFSHLDSQLAPLKPANGQCSPSSIRRPTMRPHESGTGMRNQPSTVQPGCGADGKVAMASAAGIKKAEASEPITLHHGMSSAAAATAAHDSVSVAREAGFDDGDATVTVHVHKAGPGRSCAPSDARNLAGSAFDLKQRLLAVRNARAAIAPGAKSSAAAATAAVPSSGAPAAAAALSVKAVAAFAAATLSSDCAATRKASAGALPQSRLARPTGQGSSSGAAADAEPKALQPATKASQLELAATSFDESRDLFASRLAAYERALEESEARRRGRGRSDNQRAGEDSSSNGSGCDAKAAASAGVNPGHPSHLAELVSLSMSSRSPPLPEVPLVFAVPSCPWGGIDAAHLPDPDDPELWSWLYSLDAQVAAQGAGAGVGAGPAVGPCAKGAATAAAAATTAAAAGSGHDDTAAAADAGCRPSPMSLSTASPASSAAAAAATPAPSAGVLTPMSVSSSGPRLPTASAAPSPLVDGDIVAELESRFEVAEVMAPGVVAAVCAWPPPPPAVVWVPAAKAPAAASTGSAAAGGARAAQPPSQAAEEREEEDFLVEVGLASPQL